MNWITLEVLSLNKTKMKHMSNWLRNLQGQLTELASEVLQEATVEVNDPESELQVERKKCADAERQLAVERSRAEELERRVEDLEHQLIVSNEENDAIREKFEWIVADRDAQIKVLQTQVRRVEFHQDNEDTKAQSFSAVAFEPISLHDDDERTFLSAKSSQSVTSASEGNRAELAQQRERHEAELSALMEVHAENMLQLRRQYEQRIEELQSWGDTSIHDDDNGGETTFSASVVADHQHDAEVAELKSQLDAMHHDNRRVIDELRAQLVEKEAELRALNVASVTAETKEDEDNGRERKVSTTADGGGCSSKHVSDDEEKRPPSVSAESSGSGNGGWERMGTEYVGGGAAGAPSSSSSASGEHHDDDDRHHNGNYDGRPHESEEAGTKPDDGITKRLTALESELADHKHRLKTAIALNEQLERQLAEAQEKQHLHWERIVEKEQKVIGADEKFQEQTHQMGQLQRALAAAQVDAEAALAESLEAAATENAQLKADLAAVRAELAHQSMEWHTQADEVAVRHTNDEQRIAELKATNERLQCQLEEWATEQIANQTADKTQEWELDDKNTDNNEEKQEESANKSIILQDEPTVAVSKQRTDEEYDKLVTTNTRLAAKLVAAEALSRDLEAQISEMDISESQLTETSSQLEASLADAKARVDALTTENERLREALHAAEKIASDEADVSRATAEQAVEEINRLHADVKRLRGELAASTEEKRTEAAQMHAAADEMEKLHAELADLRAARDDEAAKHRETLERNRAEEDHLRRELARLREHLLSMEEVSTREAIAAEERETQLREEIRVLQSSTVQFSESVSQSRNQFQDEIALLKEQLAATEENNAKIRQLLSDRELAHAEDSCALVNLQAVLRELGEDQTEERRGYELQLQTLRVENEAMRAEVKALHERESSLVEDRRFSEDSVTLLREELERKTAAVEELENYVEELRQTVDAAKSRGGSATAAVNVKADSSTDVNYKIDDVTLKNLFYSYFLADREKQPEIAAVMVSILGYTEEQRDAIHEANFPSVAGPGWFFGLGGGGYRSGSSRPPAGPSLTEQFIRFLEAESRALAEQPTLYVQNELSANVSQPAGIVLDEVAQLQPADSSISRSSYSLSDLKSIIDPSS